MTNDIVERLRELLEYAPETGNISWKVSRGSVKKGHICTSLNGDGYITIKVDGKSIKGHKVAWMLFHGEPPKHEIDHINGAPHDNRISNLRDVTHHTNNKNAKVRKDTSSGISGVSRHSKSGKWAATIRHNGKQNHIGVFECIAQAACARAIASHKYGYHSNHGRAK